MSHARLSPSGAYAWSRCPGKLNAVASLPPEERDKSSNAAREGSAGHHLIALDLIHDIPPASFIGKQVKYREDEPAWTITDDLAAACAKCSQIVSDKVKAYERQGYPVRMEVEVRLNPGLKLNPSREDCWGSGDVVLYVFDEQDLTLICIEVIDHKLGTGILVSAQDNDQLGLYALGALGSFWPDEGVTSTIIQPRHHQSDPDYPVVSKRWGQDEMTDFIHRMSAAAIATDDPEAPRIPGKTQCQWCAFAPHCPELRQFAMSEMTHVFHDLTQDGKEMVPAAQLEQEMLQEEHYLHNPGTLDPEALARILEIMPLARAWLNAVESEAHSRLLRGGRIPGLKLVRGRASYEYVDEEEVRALYAKAGRTKAAGGGKIPKAEYIEEKVISPAQARKRIRPVVSDKTWKKVEALISKKDGKPVLAPNSDDREEVITDARRVFTAQNPQGLTALD